jgi:hypothetical protein
MSAIAGRDMGVFPGFGRALDVALWSVIHGTTMACVDDTIWNRRIK